MRPHLVGDGIVLFGGAGPRPEPHLGLHPLVEVLVEGGPSPVLAYTHDVHEEDEARPLQSAVAPVVVECGDGRAEGCRSNVEDGSLLSHDFWIACICY